MALSNFFRVNMPYCIDIVGNVITAYNREYQPLNGGTFHYDLKGIENLYAFIYGHDATANIPIDGGRRLFLYCDLSNPSDPGKEHYWEYYQKALELLSNLQVKQ